jgi:C4-type Zn-finger protein
MKKIYHENHNLTYDMKAKVKCPSCKKMTPIKDMYNSLVHFEKSGYWALVVCEKCHQKELEEDFKEDFKG